MTTDVVTVHTSFPLQLPRCHETTTASSHIIAPIFVTTVAIPAVAPAPVAPAPAPAMRLIFFILCHLTFSKLIRGPPASASPLATAHKLLRACPRASCIRKVTPLFNHCEIPVTLAAWPSVQVPVILAFCVPQSVKHRQAQRTPAWPWMRY